jgi:orotate phosphoribosyltransferase
MPREKSLPREGRAAALADAEVREKIHLEILRRTGAYRANDHFLLPSGHHAPEYIDKALVTTEPTFTEGLGAVIAKHFAQWPADVVLSTGLGALVLAHAVARALPSRPLLVYATKGVGGTTGPQRRVRLPDEFERFIAGGTKVLIVEDLITTGETLKLLIELVERKGGTVVGIACLWQRNSKVDLPQPVFSLVRRDFPTYEPASCPLCRQGLPLNREFVRGQTLTS